MLAVVKLMQYQVNNFESEKLEVSLKRDQNLELRHISYSEQYQHHGSNN